MGEEWGADGAGLDDLVDAGDEWGGALAVHGADWNPGALGDLAEELELFEGEGEGFPARAGMPRSNEAMTQVPMRSARVLTWTASGAESRRSAGESKRLVCSVTPGASSKRASDSSGAATATAVISRFGISFSAEA